jgi:hypothetical protein
MPCLRAASFVDTFLGRCRQLTRDERQIRVRSCQLYKLSMLRPLGRYRVCRIRDEEAIRCCHPQAQQEAAVENAIIQARSVHARRLRSAPNRVDFLLTMAAAFAFVAVAAANYSDARARSRAGFISTDGSGRIGQVLPDPGLVRARIGAARMTNR